MADNSKRRWGGTWEIERLSSGGQGAVYKVANIKSAFSEEDNAIKIKAALREFETERVMAQLTIQKVQPLIDAIRQIAGPVEAQLGALKELLSPDQAVDPETAKARMKIELETLRAVSHPALVKALDDDVASGWFVMEYFTNGSLARHLDRFKGDVLGALRAIKPVVEAVSELHKKSRVHRDVKPDNVFIADDGHLVLGDCGLVFSPDGHSRLTRTRQNVGTRDYQPPWTYSQRVEDVRPTFDVFGLVKLLWAMLAGEPAFPLGWPCPRRALLGSAWSCSSGAVHGSRCMGFIHEIATKVGPDGARGARKTPEKQVAQSRFRRGCAFYVRTASLGQ